MFTNTKKILSILSFSVGPDQSLALFILQAPLKNIKQAPLFLIR